MKNRNAWLGVAAVVAFGATALVWADEKNDKGKKETPKSAEVGKPAPTFKLKSFDGKSYDLADYKDKTVVLEWFNKDCPWCKKFCDDLKKTAAAYEKKGVAWFAVDSTNFRTDEENAEYAKEHKLKYPILSDFDGKVGRAYAAAVTPHVFIVHKGTLVYQGAFVNRGGDKNYVEQALDELLAGKEVSQAKSKPFG